MTKTSGTSLVTAICVTAALLTLGLTTASLSSSNVSLAQHSVNAQSARNMAESAISLTLFRVQKNRS